MRLMVKLNRYVNLWLIIASRAGRFARFRHDLGLKSAPGAGYRAGEDRKCRFVLFSRQLRYRRLPPAATRPPPGGRWSRPAAPARRPRSAAIAPRSPTEPPEPP